MLRFLTALSLCFATAQAAQAAPPAPLEDLPTEELARVHTRGAAQLAADRLDHVRSLPDAERARAADSLRSLATHCPYTRSALQIPFALHAVVADVPPEAFPAHARWDWILLQQGLADHVAQLQALDVDLAKPGPADHLALADPSLLLDVHELEASPDPIGRTSALVAAIVPLAKEADAPTRALIERAGAEVEDATGISRTCHRPLGHYAALPGQSWILLHQLQGWHQTLLRVQPHAEDPALSKEIGRIILLFEGYEEASNQ